MKTIQYFKVLMIIGAVAQSANSIRNFTIRSIAIPSLFICVFKTMAEFKCFTCVNSTKTESITIFKRNKIQGWLSKFKEPIGTWNIKQWTRNFKFEFQVCVSISRSVFMSIIKWSTISGRTIWWLHMVGTRATAKLSPQTQIQIVSECLIQKWRGN